MDQTNEELKISGFTPDPDKPVDTKREEAALLQIIAEAARRTVKGSFADRNPMLGKMVKCPSCSRRVRQANLSACCNSVLSPVQNARKPKGRRFPRLTRNHPPLFLMRQLLLDWENEKYLVKARTAKGIIEGAPRHGVNKPIDIMHLATLAERYIMFLRKRKARAERNRSKVSRRVNRGLAKPGSR